MSHVAALAVARATDYLRGELDAQATWCDFETLAGRSTAWVSAYVADALLASPDGAAAARSAANVLTDRQRANGGWGFNDQTPTDCDSTSWAVLALSRAGVSFNRTAASTFLLGHQDRQTGGFSTYVTCDGIERFIEASAINWAQTHDCVSSVATRALLALGVEAEADCLRRAVSFLKERQRPSGLWRGYWWTGDSYATLQARLALSAAGVSDEREAEANDALKTRQRPEGSWAAARGDGLPCVFETACALHCLRSPSSSDRADDAGAATRAQNWLLATQQKNGAWLSKPILVIPIPSGEAPPIALKPDALGTHVVVRDSNALFTTASVISALTS